MVLHSASEYVALDLNQSRATVTGDIRSMPFSTNSFDLVWASHILEHIEEVDKAIAEIYRVLDWHGAAVLDVPMYGDRTHHLPEGDRHGHVWHPEVQGVSP